MLGGKLLYGAFSGCTALESVTLPENLTSIGANAFSGCTALAKTTFNGSLAQWCQIAFGNADANPASLSKNLFIDGTDINTGLLTIPSSVTSIAPYAFMNMAGITEIVIPAAITQISVDAFSGCTALAQTTFNGSLAQWCQITFESRYANPIIHTGNLYIDDANVLTGTLEIPTGVSTIGSYAFCNYGAVDSILIPDGVTSIGEYAFAPNSSDEATYLKHLVIPESVTSISANAFPCYIERLEFYCSSLQENADMWFTFGNKTYIKTLITTVSGLCILAPAQSNVASFDHLIVFEAENAALITPNHYLGHISKHVTMIFSDGTVAIDQETLGYYELTPSEIVLPTSVTTIGASTFSPSPFIKTIYYKGTQEEYGEIVVGQDNKGFTSATVYFYSATEPTDEGNYWHDNDGDGIPNIWGE